MGIPCALGHSFHEHLDSDLSLIRPKLRQAATQDYSLPSTSFLEAKRSSWSVYPCVKSDACTGIGFFYASRSGIGTHPQHRLHSKFNRGIGLLARSSLVEQALEQAGVATLRKRRLPLEMMLRCVISMAFFRRMSAWMWSAA
ncbi:transposase domain-containing protein [Pseudomonas sp. ERMR1:02]|uniref:transposase domain-containing protein n=1 Tax=unclassified Pseudomonas TaxID=196821 RepID=UPI003530D9B6